jgi:toxin ParE1/3/4
MEVIWSPLALEKVRKIAEYIALDNDIVAKKWVNDIFDKTDNIGEFPEIGRLVPELSNQKYREIIFGNYRIIYSVLSEAKILTVRNCRQLLSSDDI